jgi:hypothetical protein
MADHRDQILGWYEDGELAVCPQCGEPRVLPAEEGATGGIVCVSCGLVSPAAGGSLPGPTST